MDRRSAEHACVELAHDRLGLLLDQQQLEAREAGVDVGHHVRQQVRRERREQAQADGGRLGILRLAGDGADGVGLAQHDAGSLDDAFAGRGEVDLA
jgi:hypothetical protein